MNTWVKVGVVGGAFVAATGIAYGAYRIFEASAQPPTGNPVGPTTGTAVGTVWPIPQRMTGNQIATALGVTFPQLKAANPGSAYMIAHPGLLLKKGTKINVPSGGIVPGAAALAMAIAASGGGSTAVPAA